MISQRKVCNLEYNCKISDIPRACETRNQLQEKKKGKNHKHMEAKQYATKQPKDH